MLNLSSYLNLNGLNGTANRRKVFLIAGSALLFIIVTVFFIVSPLIHSIYINSQAIKNQKAILNYVLKYSSKIKSIKSAIPLNKPGISGASGTTSKGYLKFISSLFKYFKIGKSQVSKLYSKYSSGRSTNGAPAAAPPVASSEGYNARQGEESVFISLKGLSLNQCVNLIYAISHSASGYGAKIISINMKKNFMNAKLLNLTMNITRK